jgi:hypothetical protein
VRLDLWTVGCGPDAVSWWVISWTFHSLNLRRSTPPEPKAAGFQGLYREDCGKRAKKSQTSASRWYDSVTSIAHSEG